VQSATRHIAERSYKRPFNLQTNGLDIELVKTPVQLFSREPFSGSGLHAGADRFLRFLCVLGVQELFV
jgi:hypothetical protein